MPPPRAPVRARFPSLDHLSTAGLDPTRRHANGIEASRRMLDWCIDISHEQGIMAKRYGLDEVFAKGVLGT